MVPSIISNEGNISFIANGQQYYVNTDHRAYDNVLEGLKNDTDGSVLAEMVEQATAVKAFLKDAVNSTAVRVEGGAVIYTDSNGNEEICHGTLVERILSFMSEGLPVMPLMNFLSKMMENPSYRSAEELYDFLEHKSLPICEDGDFLAYKAVRSDYMDKFMGKFDNSVGQTVAEPRRKVDDNRDNGCSNGLHAGTLSYVKSFGSFFGNDDGDKVIIVKINPKNVVSVPTDCSCQKLRTCEYYVLNDFEGEMSYQLSTNDGYAYEPEDDDDLDGYDDQDYSYDDDEDDCDDW